VRAASILRLPERVHLWKVLVLQGLLGNLRKIVGQIDSRRDCKVGRVVWEDILHKELDDSKVVEKPLVVEKPFLVCDCM
jgi:hypothetical protein